MRYLTNEENPKPIAFVPQREDDDCAVACIAMLTGVSYDEVLKETGKPEFIKRLREKRSLPDYQKEMNQKFNQFLYARGFGILVIQNPKEFVRGRRYLANIKILHPDTNEPSALEHNVVIDESGRTFNPAGTDTGTDTPLRITALREIIFLGTDMATATKL